MAESRAMGIWIDDDLRRRLNLAAASHDGMSSSEYVRRAVLSYLAVDRLSNPVLNMVLDYEEKVQRERDSASAAVAS